MILCCGEALIDMIPSATISGQDGYVPCTGGAVFNTAIGLGRLGVRAGMMTGLSSDIFGQQLTAELHASHVDTSHVVYSNRPTTLAFVNLTDGLATYTFYDENSAGRMLSANDLPALRDEVSALYAGGISLACDPAAEAYAALIEREGTRRAVMFDPNIRPSFIRDVSGFRARLNRIIKIADIVKVSDEDLNWIYPGPAVLPAKIGMLCKAGPSVVVLTRGPKGASACLPTGEEVTVQAQPAEVVDTVGAGDTFNAGFLAQLSRMGLLTRDGLKGVSLTQLREALSLGTQVAAATVSVAGANPPWAEALHM